MSGISSKQFYLSTKVNKSDVFNSQAFIAFAFQFGPHEGKRDLFVHAVDRTS